MRWLLPLLLIGCAFPDEDFDGDGWSVVRGDCADLDPSIHPEAVDRLDDGVDQDCDGIDPVMLVSGTEHSCVLGSEGRVVCEGGNELGQLEAPSGTSVTWVKLAAGDHHTCALSVDGLVDCWGDNQFGQCSIPDVVFVDISAGFDWSLGVTADGEAVCWGRCILNPVVTAP